MSPQPRRIRPLLPAELQPVADAAGEVLCAEVDEDERLADLQAAAQAAIITALQNGNDLSAIAEAQARGQEDARTKLRGELLKQIERATRRVEQATEEQRAAIRRADRAGLSGREIGAKAGITHATVRTITGRPPALFTSEPRNEGSDGDASGGEDAGPDVTREHEHDASPGDEQHAAAQHGEGS